MSHYPLRTFRFIAVILPLLTTCFSIPVTAQTEILTAERLDVEKGLLSNQAFCSLQDRIGFLWFAAMPGLARFDGRSWEYFRSERMGRSGPSSLIINSMCEDRQGNLWLATGLGLNRFDPRRRTFRYYATDPTGAGAGQSIGRTHSLHTPRHPLDRLR